MLQRRETELSFILDYVRDGTGSDLFTRDPTRPGPEVFDPVTRPDPTVGRGVSRGWPGVATSPSQKDVMSPSVPLKYM